MRILTGGILAAFVIVLVTPGLAHAANGYHEATSAYDATPDKSATVSCPAGKKAIGSGGWVKDGNGGVALTGIVPAADLTAVTAFGRARPLHAGQWSVTAMVICTDGSDPELVFGSGVTPDCPSNKVLTSAGYRLLSLTGEQYVDEVVPSRTLTNVQVHVGGGVAPVLAFGICALAQANAARTLANAEPGPAASKDIVAGKPQMSYDFGSWVFGGGVKATGAMVDGLAPNATLDGARARAWRIQPTLVTKSARMTLAASDDWDMSVYSLCIGSWYS
jgi:hypothetical protein